MSSYELQASVAIVCILVCTAALTSTAVSAIHDQGQSSFTASLSTVESDPFNQSSTDNQPSVLDDVYPQRDQLPNTLTILSTDDERVYYNATASGRFEPTETTDFTDADQPDSVTNTTASGSAAQGGSDTFRFTGRITALNLTGGPARVYINGREVNPAAISETTPARGTTASLTIPHNERETTQYNASTLDVSGTLALDEQRLQGRFHELTLDERFATTDSLSARRAMLRTTGDRIEARIEQLRKRQSRLIAEYNDGSISSRQFLRDLARIDKAADRLAIAADNVAARASSVPESSINGQPAVNWAQNRRIELSSLQGPVRDRINEAFAGNNTERADTDIPSGFEEIASQRRPRLEPLFVYIETSRKDVVLATVDDGQYYREASFADERNATGRGLNTTTDVFTRVEELYPWATTHAGHTDLSGNRRTGISRLTLFHDHGHLTTFFNQSSGRVVAEHQQKTVFSVPPTEPIVAAKGDLRLVVNRTQPTAPLRISLETPAGDPVDGTITINDRRAERTGTDGQLWTITPQKTLRITARANGKTIRVRLPPRSQAT